MLTILHNLAQTWNVLSRLGATDPVSSKEGARRIDPRQPWLQNERICTSAYGMYVSVSGVKAIFLSATHRCVERKLI